MLVVTYSEARQNLAKLLDRAQEDGNVLIRRNDGTVFSLQPSTEITQGATWPGVFSGLTRDQIVSAVREGREREVL